MTLRVLTVLGTRPEAIKMAPVVLRLASERGIRSQVCVTAQHREMLDPVLDLFEVEPQWDLAVMTPGQDLLDLTSRVLVGMRGVLDHAAPDVVLVHGDTTTCMAAALAAFYRGIPVAHVEAGLRSRNLRVPFPEELHRVVADRLSELHFAPTDLARENLLEEGFAPERIFVTGNTVIDALKWVRARLAGRTAEEVGLPARLGALLRAWEGRVVLVTAHRRESFGEGFSGICAGIRAASQRHSDWLFVYPVHLNPNVQGAARAELSGLANVCLTSPIEYQAFVWLMDRCDLVLTDSGGMQEEAPALGKPVLVMRDVTERPEALEAGTARLVGTDPRRIVDGLESLLLDAEILRRIAQARNPYGDGRAAERIVAILRESFGEVRARLSA